MKTTSPKYLQIAAYVMLCFIFVFVIGIFRNCGRISYKPVEGFSGNDTVDLAILYGPASFYAEGDTFGGINYEIARIFEDSLKRPVKIWPVTEPADALEKLRNGNFDILASLPLDNNLKKNFHVSESVFLDRLVLVEMEDTAGNKPVSSSLDLAGKSVYVAAGSSGVQRLKNLSEEIGGDVEIVEAPEMSDELLTLKVASGSVPLAIVNERVAQSLMKEYPGLTYDNSVSFTQFQVWVFAPSDSLLLPLFNRLLR